MGRPVDDVRDLDDQQELVDRVGRLAEALPGFPFTVGPADDGVVSVLVAAEDLERAESWFAERPLRLDGDRALRVAVRPEG